MQKSFSKTLLFLTLLPLLSSCANSFNDLFSGYNQQMTGVKEAQRQGKYPQAISLIPERSSSDGTYGLALLEKARLEYLAHNTVQSLQDFEKVSLQISKENQAARVEISRGVESVAAVISNDSAKRYDITYYEQSMLHTYQALNYLAQKNLSGALVEVRRANLVQENALKANLNTLYAKQTEIASQELPNQYPTMKNAIGTVKNGFQNAYTFYLSALLYEAAGEQNSAYIDYKKALEIYPDNSYLQQPVWRLAEHLQMTSDIALYRNRMPKTITTALPKGNSGQLVLIVENGIVAPKQETSLSLPIYTSHNDLRFYSVSLPSYQNHLINYAPLQLTYAGKIYQSEEVVRLQSLAAKQLQDDLPGIVTRQIARLVAKEEIRQQMARKGGDIGNIFASIYSIATENADTRSWSTLPDNIHILKVDLSSGDHQITLNINGTNQVIQVSISNNRQTLVKLSAIGSHINHHTFNL